MEGLAGGDVGSRRAGVGHRCGRIGVEGAAATELSAEHLGRHPGRAAGVINGIEHIVGRASNHPLIDQVAAGRCVIDRGQIRRCAAFEVAGAAGGLDHPQARLRIPELNLASIAAAGLQDDGLCRHDLPALAEQGRTDGRADVDVGAGDELDPAASQIGVGAVVAGALRHPQGIGDFDRLSGLHLERQGLVGLLCRQHKAAAGLEADRQRRIDPITGCGGQGQHPGRIETECACALDSGQVTSQCSRSHIDVTTTRAQA